MYCSNCGSKIKNEFDFCPNCEADPLFEYNYCPHCGHESHEDICGYCGKSVCRICGTIGRTTDGICEKCEEEGFKNISLVRWIMIIVSIVLIFTFLLPLIFY